MRADTAPGKVSGATDANDTVVRHHLARLAQVAAATSSSVVVTDAQGVIVWVNEGFTRITGYRLDEAVGRTPGKLLQGPQTDRAEAARIGAAVRSRQGVAAELLNYTKDGRPYWVGLKIEPLLAPNGEADGFMSIQADITKRREQHQAIEKLTRRFDLATRAAHIGIFERDANFEIVWWSEVMWEIFGQDPATFKPSNESFLAMVHPEDRERIREEVDNIRRAPANDRHYRLQYRIVRPDGDIRHIRAIGAPAEPDNGVVSAFGGVVFDITERVEAEEREQALQNQLREISHQTGMAEMATGVLHNVGNVLNSLGVANSTARRELRSLRIERLEQATNTLRSNRETLAAFLTSDERGRHLPDYLSALSAQIAVNTRAIQAELDATDQLLHHLSDIVSAQQELARIGGRYESIGLRDLVDRALVVQAAELKQIEVVRDYAELPTIMTDRHKLLQILLNLLGNARDAVQAGDSGRRQIRVQLARDGNDALVVIEDSGIGMSEEVLSKIWQFGFTTKENGHGFGLHNSANAAHAIGGTLTAHSDGLGQGSRFVLRLPLVNPDPMLSGVVAV